MEETRDSEEEEDSGSEEEGKHNFPFINICKVPREVSKTEDDYYGINSTKHCKNKESIITSHFPMRVSFQKYANSGRGQVLII